MEFEKLYMFNPFTIQNVDSREIAETYSNLQKELKMQLLLQLSAAVQEHLSVAQLFRQYQQ